MAGESSDWDLKGTFWTVAKWGLSVAFGIALGFAIEPAVLNLFHYDPGGIALVNATQDGLLNFFADTGISDIFMSMAEWFQPGIGAEMAMTGGEEILETAAGEDVFVL